jgi:hypothetical protein
VPWTVDYLSTKFKVTIPHDGSVVIVLSQLDDRYFKGLEGQYDFHLQFRLHKDGEDEYIVRSNAAYYMKRSVSTELELEAGTYWVLLKIEAKRYPETPTVEDVIAKTCQFRRGKLLQVGLSYDMAHAKGNFHELETDKARRRKQERKQSRVDLSKKMYGARTRQHKKQKLRSLKIDLKRQEKQMQRVMREAEFQKRQEAAAAAAKFEEMRILDNGAVQPPQSQPALKSPAKSSTYPQNGHTQHRRDTLTVDPPAHRQTPVITGANVPDIRFQTARVEAGGRLTLSDISDDDLDWDSELDGPDTDVEDDPIIPGQLNHRHHTTVPNAECEACGRRDAPEDDDEFQKDPWNAVCVVGLRVYSEGQQVDIEVVRGGGLEQTEADGQKQLDVDDVSKDAADASRTPMNSPISPQVNRIHSIGALLKG